MQTHIHFKNATIHIASLAGLEQGLPGFTGLTVRGESTADESSLRAASFAAKNALAEPPAPGEYWPGQGGLYLCTLPALFGMPARHLVTGEGETTAKWGIYDHDTDAKSHTDGPANTAALVALGTKFAAAQWARAYTADGHTDFYLPSRMDWLYAYLSAPQLFSKEGWYWSSTQVSRGNAFVQDFEYGCSDWDGKDDEPRVRAFRWIPLSA
jgi:hypothetical protein